MTAPTHTADSNTNTGAWLVDNDGNRICPLAATPEERRRERQQLALWQLHVSLAATQEAFGDDWREVVERAVSEVGGDTAVASEPVLRREWDTPEEDEAWKEL